MKFQITMKDPDGVYESIRDAAEASLASVAGLTGEERESLMEQRQESIKDDIKRWFEYTEYLTVEVDTELRTCVVVVKE